ncbi:MAG: NAD-binding protein [Wenzhouxiangellaceae bacterium]|nr:NAD-binding protein [Wenzhouxiangellaceae bacterium]MBS3745972.1 NAD-binding protein [Wenzhouxiangellaceae bacterium]MBS3822334.1 NAD-binding protein [Wenzhouxiangellaceae bacterium]
MKTESLLFLFFRRMRLPLIVLISAYAIATVGFTLLPGMDDQGNPWRMSLFEAFYVVSYTGSTIGFGEIPYDFTPAQRMWTMVSIYLTVIAWLYSIGSIISLMQDPVYRSGLRRARQSRGIRSMSQPFYLICGYGDTGRILVRALSARGYPIVIVEKNREKVDTLEIEDLGVSVTAFVMDAQKPDNLVTAGLRNRWCAGVIAVTGSDRINLKIAISAKLLNHTVVVHAHADTEDAAANMRSFDTDYVVNPVEEYVRRMDLAISRPDMFRLYQWISAGPDARLSRTRPVPAGQWIVCGYTQVGRAVAELLERRGMTVTMIDPNPQGPGRPSGTVAGRGTQAETLQAAGVESAVGVVAATSDDADNLSILITARDLNEELFFAALENGFSTHALFQAARSDFVAQPSAVIAGYMLSRLSSGLVEPFLASLMEQDDDFARGLLAKLLRHQDEAPPELSSGRISARRSPAIARALEAGIDVPLGTLLRDPCRRDSRLPLEIVLLRREDGDILCPEDDEMLQIGDRILMAGRSRAARAVRPTLDNDQTLEYLLTGRARQHGWVWQWLERRAKDTGSLGTH